MTAKSPAFQCYSRDVAQRIKRLSTEERGAYLTLWLWSWTEGPLPAAPGELARIAEVSLQRMRAMLPALRTLLEEREGHLVFPDLEQQRTQQEQHRKKRQHAAETRWGGHRDRAPAPLASRNGSGMNGSTSGPKLEGGKVSNRVSTSDARAMHVECSAVAVATAGKTNPPTTSTASARAPEGGWGMAAEEIIGRDDWWHGEPTDLRRQLLPAVMARRTAKDPSATVWGAIKYVLRQPRAGTEHAAAANGNGKSPEAPPLPPELLEPFQRFSALPKPERERWTERGRRKAPGNLTGEDLERAILVCALREFAAAERAPPSHQAA
jgi:uncharacterized protein YdaU (DUF1376 family)